jgi:hypothetical protein
MTRPAFELAGIIQEYGSAFIEKYKPHPSVLRTLDALSGCRTQAMGGHVDVCDSCDHLRISYNSCRNRHCPKCQNTNRERWIVSREQDLLPVKYFHVVFTLPEQINAFCVQYPQDIYNKLFEASKETIEAFAGDQKHLGAQTGMISVLHTWGQNLSLHPHVHMIIPGGGVTQAGNWKNTKGKGDFLFPVKAMSQVYRAKFMEKLLAFLKAQGKAMDQPLRQLLYQKSWVIYAKRPFLGPRQVIEYLGRYTHKIAISNHRILSAEKGKVTFRYKDYAKAGKQSIMSLEATEFIRRFCLHILPKGFRKIRHYGFLASRNKPRLRFQQFKMGIKTVKTEKVDWKRLCKEKLEFDPDSCPCCKTGKLMRIFSFAPNAPPSLQQIAQRQKEVSE